ncbi:MAG: hypothetical protein GX279_13650 [Clostridiaceae bacterium]|jgi:hypothetical protein|nr:hypothetical protein [Clostridiaceae bacterium]
MKYFLVLMVVFAMVFNTGCVRIEGKDRQNVQEGIAGQDNKEGPVNGSVHTEGSGLPAEGPAGSDKNADPGKTGTGADADGDGEESAIGSTNGSEASGDDNGSNGSTQRIYPIVALDYLLGGSGDNGEWITATNLADQIKGGETYYCYAFDKLAGMGTGSKVELLEPIDTVSVTVACENEYQLAVGGGWNALPRVPVSQSTNSETYKKIVKDVLTQEGLPDAEAVIRQNYRIDLEGDGVDEVLIWASNLDYENVDIAAKKGQYSIIILRRIIDGEVKNIPVSYMIYTSDTIYEPGEVDEFLYENANYFLTCVERIRSIADVNGDGKMEVIIDSRLYEGESIIVYELQGDKMVDVLYNGWGL